MGNTSLIRTALLIALLTAFGLAATGRAPAADRGAAGGDPRAPVTVVGSEASSQFLPLGVGKSVVIDLPRDIKDVLVAEPKFANAVVRSTRRVWSSSSRRANVLASCSCRRRFSAACVADAAMLDSHLVMRSSLSCSRVLTRDSSNAIWFLSPACEGISMYTLCTLGIINS